MHFTKRAKITPAASKTILKPFRRSEGQRRTRKVRDCESCPAPAACQTIRKETFPAAWSGVIAYRYGSNARRACFRSDRKNRCMCSHSIILTLASPNFIFFSFVKTDIEPSSARLSLGEFVPMRHVQKVLAAVAELATT